MKVHFEEIFTDCTKLATKIPQANYLPSGRYPIVDQGQSQIAGYTNTSEGLFTDVPAIIFGDHTRIVKYIDTPFFIGADGVKVLKSILQDANYKYLFYALNNVKIPNTGYNRHFKWLKESSINLSDRKEQKRIAERLDKVQELIALQKEQLKKLDDLIKSRFIDLFGNPETNTKHWPLISWDSLFSVVTGKLDANAMEENGKYPFFTCAKESFRINSYAFDQKALLLAGNNATADYDVKFYEGKFNAYQRTYVISLKNEQCSYIVYKFLLEQKLQLMKRLSKGTNTRYLTLSILKDFKFLDLPVEQQTQFADFVTKIEAQKGLLATRLSHLETLYKSLMQEYFG